MTERDLDEAYAAALSDLPGMGPATLVAALNRDEPRRAWERVRRGELTRPDRRRNPAQIPMAGVGRSRPLPWADIASGIDPPRWWEPFSAAGVRATWPGSAGYPSVLIDDPQPPGVLFWRGSISQLDRPCVAVVGTRHATPDGRSVAFELGRDLVEAGVCVVSGLALGIDAAAHSGAIEALRRLGDDAPAATVGVAASGVDVPYPRRHAGLWEEVVRLGAVVSETPPGRAAQAWRFPMRNRVIAGLVRMVVVVESHARGGSLITAEAALERGVDVRVVPGPVHSPASAGSNQLLYDGPGPVRNARDVLDGLGMIGPLQTATCPRTGPRQGPGSPDEASQVGCEQADEASQVGFEQADEAVLAAVGWQPTTLNRVAIRTGRSIGSAAGSLERLASLGWVRGDQGWWTRVR